MLRRHILVVTAGAALTLGCGGPRADVPGNPPEPEVIPPPRNPPGPEPGTIPEAAEGPEPAEPADEADDRIPEADEADEADAQLPTWDEVPSGHPPGATNPPAPELIVTPDGTCHKRWVSPMKRGAHPFGDRVEDCETDCGTEIVCPPRAEELLAAWRAAGGNTGNTGNTGEDVDGY